METCRRPSVDKSNSTECVMFNEMLHMQVMGIDCSTMGRGVVWMTWEFCYTGTSKEAQSLAPVSYLCRMHFRIRC